MSAASVRRMAPLLLALALLALTACGNKGPLVHPDAEPAPASSSGSR